MADAVGPRYSAAIALLLTAPLMFGMALMQTAAGFIALRMLVGLGLSMFVVNQKWMGEMFNRQILGRATALSAGERQHVSRTCLLAADACCAANVCCLLVTGAVACQWGVLPLITAATWHRLLSSDTACCTCCVRHRLGQHGLWRHAAADAIAVQGL
jgi:nitrate/nitrite transporter NarK